MIQKIWKWKYGNEIYVNAKYGNSSKLKKSACIAISIEAYDCDSATLAYIN